MILARMCCRLAVLIAASSALPKNACAQNPARHAALRLESGIHAFVGIHLGVPERLSSTFAGAVGLAPIAPGFAFVAVEPGYGSGRRSIGWLVRDPDKPLTAFGDQGFGVTVRLSQLTTYQHVALYRAGRTYYGPELHIIFASLGARLGVFAGAGPGAARTIVALGLGGGI